MHDSGKRNSGSGADRNDRIQHPWFLQGGGTAGQTARAVNWADTPVGPPETWPVPLRTTLATMFHARQPMFLWWGPALVQFYNDGYLPSFGRGKHPAAMGQRGRECWQEIWPIIGPQIEAVMDRAIGSWHEDALVPIWRNDKLEEVYWTYSYSPVYQEDGRVGGTLVICTETTQRVLAERRARALRALVDASATAIDTNLLSERASVVLEDCSIDVPFFLLCRCDADDSRLRVQAVTGLGDEGQAEVLCLVRDALTKDSPLPDVLPLRAGVAPLGLPEWVTGTVEEAYVVGFPEGDADTGGGGVTGNKMLMVFGVSPVLSFDPPYRRFLDQFAAYLESARRRISETYKRSKVEIELRNLLEQAPVATALLVGPDHVFEIANPRYRQMVGRPKLIGQSYAEAFPELIDTDMPAILDRVYETGEPFWTHEHTVEMDRGNGVEKAWFHFNLEPVRDILGKVYGMMAVAVDITEQVQSRLVLESANAEREALLSELRTASRAKDEFLAMLGHELRNPLAPIQTALALARQKSFTTGSGLWSEREYQIIDRQVRHLTRLVDDLLDVSRIARGKVELRTQLIDVASVVRNAVETTGDLFERHRHQLIVHCPVDTFFCDGDAIRLTQVVANLLTNAARYTSAGGAIELAVSQKGNEIVISVKDDGVGMSEEMLPRVFDLFEQGQRSSDRAEGGLGIGLALVKNLVSLHGGKVSAHSEGLGHGSEFRVRLPAQDRPQRAVGQGVKEMAGCPRVSRRILIVDDNVDALELLKETLDAAGHETVTATDAPSALHLAKTFAPQIAILDIGLPVVDGYELAAELLALGVQAPSWLFALTGYGQSADRARSREAGFDAHLVKPVDVSELLAIIEKTSVPKDMDAS